MIPVSCDDKRIKKNLHYDNIHPFSFFNTGYCRIRTSSLVSITAFQVSLSIRSIIYEDGEYLQVMIGHYKQSCLTQETKLPRFSPDSKSLPEWDKPRLMTY